MPHELQEHLRVSPEIKSNSPATIRAASILPASKRIRIQHLQDSRWSKTTPFSPKARLKAYWQPWDSKEIHINLNLNIFIHLKADCRLAKQDLKEIAKVSHGSVSDLISTALLTIWKRKENGLLNFTCYALKCIAGLDRKNKYKQSIALIDWDIWNEKGAYLLSGPPCQHHWKKKFPRPLQEALPNLTDLKENGKIIQKTFILFGKNKTDAEEMYHPKHSLALRRCWECFHSNRDWERQRAGSSRWNCRKMWQLKRQFNFRDRKHRNTYHRVGCYSLLSLQL